MPEMLHPKIFFFFTHKAELSSSLCGVRVPIYTQRLFQQHAVSGRLLHFTLLLREFKSQRNYIRGWCWKNRFFSCKEFELQIANQKDCINNHI
uniref:Uncharacterized protein n=1 Tax=Xiphophorus couchianus TaxID=32473 RepID=A0A3B5KKY0_9TELE